MIRINTELTPGKLLPRIERLFETSAEKIRAIEKTFDAARGSPVSTVEGVYAARDWTDWTQGFMYGWLSSSTMPRVRSGSSTTAAGTPWSA